MGAESDRNGMAAVLVGFLVIVFAATVWPSIYKTYPRDGHTYREHRLTGRKEVWTPAGWLPPAADLPNGMAQIPPDAFKEVDHKLDFHSGQHCIWTKFHNRTAWTIYEIIVEVRLKDGPSRRYALRYTDGVAPSETGIFYADADVDASKIATVRFESANGTQRTSSR